jgi:hypothetical protein
MEYKALIEVGRKTKRGNNEMESGGLMRRN